jgi:hypothetical protein
MNYFVTVTATVAAVFGDPVAVARTCERGLLLGQPSSSAVSLRVVLPLPGDGSVAGEKARAHVRRKALHRERHLRAEAAVGRPTTRLTLVLPPRLSLIDAAPTPTEMPGACSVNVAVLLTPPPVAVTVSVYLPGATALPTLMAHDATAGAGRTDGSRRCGQRPWEGLSLSG